MVIFTKQGTRVGIWQGRRTASLGIDSKRANVGMVVHELEADDLDRVINELKRARAALETPRNGATHAR